MAKSINLFMVRVKLLGSCKRIFKSDMINIKANSIDEIIYILKENGIETNDLLILVNGIEYSLVKGKRINENDIVTIASIVHGG